MNCLGSKAAGQVCIPVELSEIVYKTYCTVSEIFCHLVLSSDFAPSPLSADVICECAPPPALPTQWRRWTALSCWCATSASSGRCRRGSTSSPSGSSTSTETDQTRSSPLLGMARWVRRSQCQHVEVLCVYFNLKWTCRYLCCCRAQMKAKIVLLVFTTWK